MRSEGEAWPPGRTSVALRWISPVLLPDPVALPLRFESLIGRPGFGACPFALGFTTVAPRSDSLPVEPVWASTTGAARAAAMADVMINREKGAMRVSPFQNTRDIAQMVLRN